MSINGLFNIGKSALFASQTQLSITSNNIANASTPGYSRQEVILEIATTSTTQAGGFLGGGVSVAGIKRSYDSLLQNQINSAQQDYGQASTLSDTLTKIEQLFNETQDLGLAGPLEDFFNAWQGVTSKPEGLTERNLLLQKADALVLSAQRMEGGIHAVLKQIQEGIAGVTDQINSLASKIARLNDQIIQIEAGSSMESAGSFRDQRETALKDLSNLVELSYWEDRSNGSLTVTMGMKTLVDGNSTNPLSAVYNDQGDFILQLDGQDITSRITRGEMGGLLTARQEIGTYLHDFRKLVASVIHTVNLQHAGGFDLDGSTNINFFDPLQLSVKDFSSGADLVATITDYSQLTLDEYEIQFNGGNFEVYDSGTGALKTSGVYNAGGTTINLEGIQFDITGPVTDLDRFTVSPLTAAVKNFQTAITAPRQIAASGTATGLPGDNTNALALADLFNSRSTALNSETFANYYQALVGRIGSQSQSASDELTFSDNFLTGLTTRRDAVSGVNMDEEAADLIRFQRAYEAAARLIRTADELLQTLLNL